MSRLVALTLIVSLSNTSLAFAGETLADVATRIARQAPRNQATLEKKSVVATSVQGKQKNWMSSMAQDQPALSSSGMGKRTKILIFMAAAAGFVAAAYVIDHKVEDNTPSTLGLRVD